MKINLTHCSIPFLRIIVEESKNKDNIREVLEFNEEAVYKVAARNVYTDKDTLKCLYEKYGEEVAWALAENTSTPQEVLHDIALKEYPFGIAKNLIGNEMLAADDIDLLVEEYLEKEEYSYVIAKAIDHDNISAKTLLKIADKYPQYIGKIVNTGRVKLVEK